MNIKLFTIGSVWKTNSGFKATVIANDLKGTKPIVFKVCMHSNFEYIATTDVNGYSVANCDHIVNIWREPVKVSGWIAIGSSQNSPLYHNRAFATEWAQVYDTKAAIVYVEGTEEFE